MEMEMEQKFSLVRVKRESSVEYLFILPPATEDGPTDLAENVQPKLGADAGCQEEPPLEAIETEYELVEVRQEPLVDYLFILPPAAEGEPTNREENVQPKPGADAGCQGEPLVAIEMEYDLVEVKQEPAVDYLFILPPATNDCSAPQQAAVVKPKRARAKKLASPTNVFNCDEYSYQTKVRGNLTRHKGSHNKSFQCETCEKKFSTNQNLKRHQMQHKHGIYVAAPDETFDCSKCNKSFSAAKNLHQHHAKVHAENEVKCGVCDKICKNRYLYLQHSRSHVKEECSICHKTVSKLSMAHHMRLHSAENLFECDICDYSANTKKDLKVHIERMHLLRKLVEDSKCRDDFDDFELLDKLQLKHGSPATTSEKNFECEKCGKSYVTQTALKQHKKEFHSEATFECETCKKAFKTKGSLNIHKAVHLKVSCSICNKKIGQRYLKSHMRIHQIDNHLECDLCGFKAEKKSVRDTSTASITIDRSATSETEKSPQISVQNDQTFPTSDDINHQF